LEVKYNRNGHYSTVKNLDFDLGSEESSRILNICQPGKVGLLVEHLSAGQAGRSACQASKHQLGKAGLTFFKALKEHTIPHIL